MAPKFLFCSLFLICFVVGSQHKREWESWKLQYNKHYSDQQEDEYRYKIWDANRARIEQHNKEKHSFTMAVNKFADLTTEEFRYKIHGNKEQGSCLKEFTEFAEKYDIKVVNPGMNLNYDDLPESIDWANGTDYVTPVKNQGDCGSCWAFSSTGSTESRYAIAKGELNSLSEQELVDCSDAYGNAGCDGGNMDPSFEYIKNNDGLSLEADYSYKGRDGTCKKEDYTHYNPVSGFEIVERDNATALMAALVNGPVSIGIQADQTAFEYYDGGVLDGKCGTQIDHGVLVVGYGVDEETNEKYWKVKNSWGDDWGEDGYVRICRECDKNDGKGECCILCQPSYPTVD